MLRNRDGVTIDPVPFLVVSVLGFAMSFVVAPLYVMAFGATLATGLAVAVATTLVTALAAYYRYIWTERPALRSEVPVQARFERLLYGVVAGFLLVAALALPFLAR